MKKIIISMLLIAAPVATFAQLTVFSDGKVDIYRQTENPGALLAVDKNEYTGYGSYNMTIIAGNDISNLNVSFLAATTGRLRRVRPRTKPTVSASNCHGLEAAVSTIAPLVSLFALS